MSQKIMLVIIIILNINYDILYATFDNPDTPRPCTSRLTDVADPPGCAETR